MRITHFGLQPRSSRPFALPTGSRAGSSPSTPRGSNAPSPPPTQSRVAEQTNLLPSPSSDPRNVRRLRPAAQRQASNRLNRRSSAPHSLEEGEHCSPSLHRLVREGKSYILFGADYLAQPSAGRPSAAAPFLPFCLFRGLKRPSV
jgi:hypothetical protein